MESTPKADRRLCYEGRDGLLCSFRTNRLYIPEKWRNSFMFWCHAGEYGCHKGMNSTARRLKKFVWWPNLHHDVKKFVGACLICARNRTPVRLTTTMVLSKPAPFELVSVDFVGPREVQLLRR
eukprot:Selendium_serpulae@DN4544_c0_g1_i1.p2